MQICKSNSYICDPFKYFSRKTKSINAMILDRLQKLVLHSDIELPNNESNYIGLVQSKKVKFKKNTQTLELKNVAFNVVQQAIINYKPYFENGEKNALEKLNIGTDKMASNCAISVIKKVSTNYVFSDID